MTTWKAPTTADRPIMVYGARYIGRRIACTWVAAGYNVNIVDIDLKERAEALQYVIEHLAPYMRRIGSTKKGIITASENLDTANVSNPWLVIEALPDLLPALQRIEIKTDLLGDLDAEMPEDCLLCMNSIARSRIFLRKVNRPHRVLNLHHYLVPNVRVIEMVKNEHTDQATVDFLTSVIPGTGALPILARNEESSMTFRRVWDEFKQEVLGALGKDVMPADIDETWEKILLNTPTEDLCTWFDNLGLDYDEIIEKNYTVEQGLGHTALSHLKKIFSEEGKLAPFSPYDGLELRSHGWVAKLSTPLQRSGPDIYFVDIGSLGDDHIGNPDQGRILCGYTDGTVRVLVPRLLLPYCLAIHIASKRIYWSDIAECTIASCSHTGSSVRIIVPKNGRPSPKQLAIDQTASQIYWTQSDGTQILRCNTDGTSIETLLETSGGSITATSNPVNWPTAIALDPAKRHFYWSQPCLNNPRRFCIFRASMDMPHGSTPSKREDIKALFSDLPEILDMDFVPVFEELYWSAHYEEPVTHQSTNIHRGYVGPIVDADMKTQDIVIGGLKGIARLKTDPKGGHVYTTSLDGLVARFDMTTGGGEYKLYRERDGSFIGIALMYGEAGPGRVAKEVEEAEVEVVAYDMVGNAGEDSSLSTESTMFSMDVDSKADTTVGMEVSSKADTEVDTEVDSGEVIMEDARE